MKILIAGLGSIGRRHLKNLLALGEQDILLYRTRRGTLPDDELSGFPVETDLTAALDHHPQAVIVSNPTALHLEVAIPAAERGCHLLLEKPISHSMQGVDRLQDAVRRGGGQVLVGFQFRFHPGLQKIKDLLSSPPTPHPSPDSYLLSPNSLGRPLSVRAHWGEYLPGWHPWEDYRQGYSARSDLGGGVILTLSHPLDYLRWLFGEVKALWAFDGNLGDLALDVEDTAEIGLQYQSGVLGSVHLDYNQRPSAHTLEIIGTQGVIRWDNATGAVQGYSSPTPLSPPPGEGKEKFQGIGAAPQLLFPEKDHIREGLEIYPAPTGFERNDLFLREMRHFLAVARREQSPLCTLHDGIQALRLALAAQDSAKTGKMAFIS